MFKMKNKLDAIGLKIQTVVIVQIATVLMIISD